MLAASFFLATLLVSSWVASLRQQLNLTRQSLTNLAIFDLNPAAETQRNMKNAEPLALSPSSERYVVLLYPDLLSPFSNYGCTLRDAGGEILWRGQGLRPTEFGSFAIELSRTMTPPGVYRLELQGLNDDEPVLVQTFAVRILPTSPA